MAEPQLLLNYTGHLPECPTWSAEEHALYWADILEGEIHRYHLPTAEHTVLSFHEEVGCFALREQGGFIVAMRTGIWLTDKHGHRFSGTILRGHVLGAGRLQRCPADAHRQRPDAESDPV